MHPDCFIIWSLKEEPHMDQGEASERTIGFEQNPYFATFLIHSCSTEIGNKSPTSRKQHQLKNPWLQLTIYSGATDHVVMNKSAVQIYPINSNLKLLIRNVNGSVVYATGKGKIEGASIPLHNEFI